MQSSMTRIFGHNAIERYYDNSRVARFLDRTVQRGRRSSVDEALDFLNFNPLVIVLLPTPLRG